MRLPSAASSHSNVSIMCPSTLPRHPFVFVPRIPTPLTPDALLPNAGAPESLPEPCLIPRRSARVSLPEPLYGTHTRPTIPIRYSKRWTRIRPNAVDEDSLAQAVTSLPHSEDRVLASDTSKATLRVLLQREERDRRLAIRRVRHKEFDSEKRFLRLHALRRSKLRETRDFRREQEEREAAARALAAEPTRVEQNTGHEKREVSRAGFGFINQMGSTVRLGHLQTRALDEYSPTLQQLERELTHGSVVRPATASTEQPFSRQQSLLSREASRIRKPLSGRQSPVLAPLLPPLSTAAAGLSTRPDPLPKAQLNAVTLPVPQGVQAKNIPLKSLDDSHSQSLVIVEHQVRSLTTVRPERTLSLSLESRADPRKQRTVPADTRLHSYLTLPEVTSACPSSDSERCSNEAGAFAEGAYGANDGTGSGERRAVEQVSDNKGDPVTMHCSSPVTLPSNKEKYRRDRYRRRQREHAIEMARRQRHFFDAIQEEFLKDSKSSIY